MSEHDIEKFIKEIQIITNNELIIKTNSINTKNNYFLFKIQLSSIFKELTISKIKRLYNTYKNDTYKKDIILKNVKKLFCNNWDGAYSELTAYDMLNLAFDSPCDIQINNIKKEETLAKYCKNKEVSEIDGYIDDAFMFFEVKTLQSRFIALMNKIKQELQSYEPDDYFIIQSDYPLSLEINDDKKYTLLKNEIIEAKKKKEKSINSNVIDGLCLRFLYEKKSVLIETHVCESPYEMAERLERLPLKDYNQFVDGRFIKVFVSHNLNQNEHLTFNGEFFRALSRRVFCKLTKENERFDENSDLQTSFIAQHLSGILFIVDLSTSLKEETTNPNDIYQAYFYTNPNVKKENALFNIGHYYSYFNRMKYCKCDDFIADNY